LGEVKVHALRNVSITIKEQEFSCIMGPSGSGKTTLLNVVSAFIPPTERIITIEDIAELQLKQEHVGRLEKRPSNVEGKGEDAFLSSQALKEMDSLQRYLEKNVRGVGGSLSLVEYIKGMNMVMFCGNRQEFRIPDNDQTTAEYLFLYSLTGFPGDFDPVVNYNYQYANIKIDLKDHKAATINEALEKTKDWIQINHKNQDTSGDPFR
jgi:energy-coupling factor transporter ATP-binding protein EcfA2